MRLHLTHVVVFVHVVSGGNATTTMALLVLASNVRPRMERVASMADVWIRTQETIAGHDLQ